MFRRLLPVVLLALLATPAVGGPLPDGARVAYFGLTFIDTSTEGDFNGERPDETERLAMATAYVAEDMTKRGFTLVSLDPVRAELDRVSNPAKCNGCTFPMARKIGADYVLVGEVQKTSNLILSMNLVLSEAATGRQLAAGVVDIRGNTDVSWTRGLGYLLRNRIFRQ
ncbi:DUF3280 domain-containing protein [Polymorphum gilvum]|uniref:DUF2380 domain-containing protein n=1 Tax=Polymorphum gilvum (strain LMG 25793 / CGMCC 1.9160 / SL003B-26A1) TaxID=991905 RepID=F2IXX0_POLGS|nr:DUF3280 domain-containing protein [Polymorphum gilvum]ADZ69451.1 hypothetical protein SL003B_1022 [Polymorphum gilvum SL003B-26A1]